MTSLEHEFPDDLPPDDLWSEALGFESSLHAAQLLMLLDSIELYWKDRADFFAAGNLTVYFSPKQLKNEKFNGPDFFVVLGTERRPRKSWTVWHEDGKYPNVIVEVLSHSTKKLDQGLKKQVYQDVFRTPEYFWFDPETKEFAGFRLLGGRYEPIPPDSDRRLWSTQLDLSLGVHEDKLRFFTKEGTLVPTGRERAERLAEKLRALGVDPDSV
ncbi:Uma2 family endonuclease [Polyangium sorediatum]|uniref:Uma2 family endonuclease n=1 Tax=Polyangium sorediatum TaxID=889274 RepID=A0ABT6NUQ8_9BACT|nr:Uma2 family endonuclease [Polyangium sorediatum]MDI1431882.1 Uma2 family endonuclease [Polyangium sorediatum]